jgi:hypothetical protein
VLEETNVAAAALLLKEHEQLDTAMEEASVAHNFLRAKTSSNAITILDESRTTPSSKFKFKNSSIQKFFHHLHIFCKAREK